MAQGKTNWERLLSQFTNRNASRLTTIEVDDIELGAQQEEASYPLRGVAYDHRADQVEIMLGDLSSTAHLTHTVARPASIDLQSGTDGRDKTLRISTEGGRQTLLRLLD